MRTPTKPSTANCTLSMYISFLLSEPKNATCTRLSEILPISHDSVNRFLLRESYNPKELWNVVKEKIVLQGGTLSVDDSVIDKPYSEPNKTELIDYFWSGKHKCSVKGINFVTLYYTDINQVCMPVNFRIVFKPEGKTKNEYFRDMLAEVLVWGLQPLFLTGDSWYSGLDNLKCVRHHTLSAMFAIKNNRLVSALKGTYVQVQCLDIPESGKVVYLKEFGMVKVFRTVFKNEYHYYILYVPNFEQLNQLTYSDFKVVHNNHWNIEQFHRAVKQVCNIERFQVRTTQAVKNHIFCAFCAFVQLEFMRTKNTIFNWYEIQKNLFNDVIRAFIINHVENVDIMTESIKV